MSAGIRHSPWRCRNGTRTRAFRPGRKHRRRRGPRHPRPMARSTSLWWTSPSPPATSSLWRVPSARTCSRGGPFRGLRPTPSILRWFRRSGGLVCSGRGPSPSEAGLSALRRSAGIPCIRQCRHSALLAGAFRHARRRRSRTGRRRRGYSTTSRSCWSSSL